MYANTKLINTTVKGFNRLRYRFITNNIYISAKIRKKYTSYFKYRQDFFKLNQINNFQRTICKYKISKRRCGSHVISSQQHIVKS